jgi:membrane-associated phospholipid phosphatase
MMGLTPVIHDDLLIKIDFLIFGFNPTMVLKSISHPLITEFLQIIYALFYMMPVIFALELFLWHRYQELKFVTLVILFGFYLSFIGYLVLPAIGPRFILHDFYNLNNDLPGLWFTNFLRDLVNLGESIPKNTQNVELFAQRDAFPSGHTIIILLIVYLSRKIKSNSFYFYFPYSILMIFATIYLRYHYVVDLIGGLAFAILTILISNKLFSIKWKKDTVSEVS